MYRCDTAVLALIFNNLQYPSDARYKAFYTRTHSLGVRAKTTTRLLGVRNAFDENAKRVRFACETLAVKG